MIPVDAFSAAASNRAVAASLDPGDARLAIVAASNHAARRAAAAEIVRAWASRHPHATVVETPAAATWPFLHPLPRPVPDNALVLWADEVHEAVTNLQTGSTRLVTTQASYLFSTWTAALAGRDDVLLLASGDRDTLDAHAPEMLARRGPFRQAFVYAEPSAFARENRSRATEDKSGALAATPDAPAPQLALLIDAFRAPDASTRLQRSVAALELGRTAPALVATASVCMEVSDLDAAARDLDEALELEPGWAAAHFERGKLWLRLDDMERAGAAFREAAERLPSFGSAWANLGATLGELDRPVEALAAFEHALTLDPESHQALNNIGVVSRELGRLSDSEAAFRRVIGLVPELAFGHYNLGHTLFLAGRYHAALSAYTEGQRRDAERNPVQASRLAMCRLATGDADGAVRELQQAVAAVPGAYRQQLLSDTSTILWALLTHKPDLAGWGQVNAWVTREMRAAEAQAIGERQKTAE